MTEQQPEHTPDWKLECEAERERNDLGNKAFQNVTRVDLLHGGDYPEYWAEPWQVDIQDGGKAVKLKATGDPSNGTKARNAALGQALGLSEEATAAFTQAVAEADGQPDPFRSRSVRPIDFLDHLQCRC